MRRLHEPRAYAAPQACFWNEGVATPDWPALDGDASAEVAVIGGGFTGLSAALHLAEAGSDVALLEAETPGFGASGRNGGFCCLGGSKASDAMLRKRFGPAGLAGWHDTEKAAIETVRGLIARHGIDADTHSRGETILAHTARAWQRLRQEAATAGAAYGVAPELIPRAELGAHGLGGPFHGALTLPLGFALHPRKYHSGLARAADGAGARLHAQTPVTRIRRAEGRWRLETPRGSLTAERVIVATNGYSSEDVPDWLEARTMPVQSTIIVTRPLTDDEAAAQGLTSAQMAYDTRVLLHYFRRLPDGRFLFGMRGGLTARPGEQAAISARIRRHFHEMFPAWRGVEITHEWSGLVCLMANLTPYAGPVPDMQGVFAGLGYHGNGVGMSSHTGRILAALARGRAPETPWPAVMRKTPKRFPLGAHRRMLLRPTYFLAGLADL
ncbi:NAD(P)/FAD-dependent oxidoreductase [Roseivivax isoporae]|uniref:FAD dependent oxidoreductase n=1 Tax=Roseivivax isoporae LMG 25204 TaxID=1449351 RepID=X7F2E0_9RHOB|nr:FAD-binding oxidoreductase [Roseivivax isoporae]ETX26950.1 FAD dependent oxidoreductase [Roseivivax isoporae LMG 25204]